MVNQQQLTGNWNEIKGKIRQHWGQLTGDDLSNFQGDVDELVGLIQKKTGDGREKIEKYLNELTSQGASAASRASDAARDYVNRASEGVQDAAGQAADSVRRRYEEAGEMVQQRPMESLAVAFGVGLAAGLVVGLVLRSK